MDLKLTTFGKPKEDTVEIRLENVKKIHLIGAGGAGMSGLACLLQDKGFLVQGSDIVWSHKAKELQKRGIKIYIGHKKSNIDSKVDLVCYSSAVSAGNSELKEAQKKKIKIIKRGELLACLCCGLKTIAVSGSHGKTTVVTLLNYLFKKAGYNPTVFIGGLPVDGSLPAVWGRDFSIIETDESDGTFLELKPYLSIITNIDQEHLDYYQNFSNLKNSFLAFAKNTQDKVFGCGDNIAVRNILSKTSGFSFGLGSANCFRAENLSLSQDSTCFDLYKNQKFLFSLKTSLFGAHNCLNILAALSVFDHLEIDLKKVAGYLSGFKGVKRRFQTVGKFFGVTFIDDYAHHPTAIKATLDAARSLSGGRLFVILQPHRPSRVKDLFGEFSKCLKEADLAVVTDIYKASERNLKGINSLRLVEEAKKKGLQQVFYLKKEELVSKIPFLIKENDLVICLGAGDISKELEKIIYAFKKNRGKNQR